MARHFVALCAAVVVVFGGWASASALVITASADAMVRPSQADSNFGADTQLHLKNSANASVWRKAYMQFDLGGALADPLTILTGAKLHLNFIDSALGVHTSSHDWTFQLWGLDDGHAGEGWVEGTGTMASPLPSTGSTPPNAITWNNAPGNMTTSGNEMGPAMTLLGTFTVQDKGIGAIEFESPALLDFISQDTNELITIAIARLTDTDTTELTYVHSVASIQHATLAGPALELSLMTTIIPEPATAVLLGVGLALFGRRLGGRRKRQNAAPRTRSDTIQARRASE